MSDAHDRLGVVDLAVVLQEITACASETVSLQKGIAAESVELLNCLDDCRSGDVRECKIEAEALAVVPGPRARWSATFLDITGRGRWSLPRLRQRNTEGNDVRSALVGQVTAVYGSTGPPDAGTPSTLSDSTDNPDQSVAK